MKVIICGAGNVGCSIAEQLMLECHDVVVIDENASRIEELSGSLDVKGVLGQPSHPINLKIAGAEDADIIIAVTESDEVNMMVCLLAKELFSIKTKIAKVTSKDYFHKQQSILSKKTNIPIDHIIYPEKEITKVVLDMIYAPGAKEVVPIDEEHLKLIRLKPNEHAHFDGMSINRVEELGKNYKISIAGVWTDGQFALARDKKIIGTEDEIYFTCPTDLIQEVLAFFGHDEEVSQLRIIGGSDVGVDITSELEKVGYNIKIIEKNRERAEYIACILSGSTVVCGDALSEKMLEECNFSAADVVLAVSNDDLMNIVSCLLAKKRGCKTTIALINSLTLAPLVSFLGIDIVVNLKEITVSTILQYVRMKNIKEVHSLCQGKVELFEVEITDYSYVVGKKIKDLRYDNGFDIVNIIKSNSTIIVPQDEMTLEAGDKLIVIFWVKYIKKVEKIFSGELKYF